ncbi:phosphotransferase [Paenibacillus sp. Marseille-Q4541]|uniref:phosphotransferase family protein n=1 Tax=Paenibacillus sp. Marseille-Q4541 TaxID=2831522 RepID=UPI001BAA6268|nr:phosphotransferase [Paenibacillus sp. Marseille-Q4541]
METATKRKLSEHEIYNVAARAFPGSTLVNATELTDGWANSAYVLTVQLIDKETKQSVLKVATTNTASLLRYERDLMTAEVEAFRLSKEAGLSFIPEVLYHDVSREVIDAEYFVMSFIPGRAYSKVKSELSAKQRSRIEHQLGVYNQVINEITGSTFGYLAQKERQCSTWREAFLGMLDDQFADAADSGVAMPASIEVMREAMYRIADCLDEVTVPRLVLWDLWDGNIMVEDGEISGLIDFERAFWGDSLMEFYFNHFQDSQDFRNGYGIGVLTETEKSRLALYNLYSDIIMWVECDFRKIPDEGHVKWAWGNLVQGWEKFNRQYGVERTG